MLETKTTTVPGIAIIGITVNRLTITGMTVIGITVHRYNYYRYNLIFFCIEQDHCRSDRQLCTKMELE